jgi:CBS domain containing-hemolysin-like protein
MNDLIGVLAVLLLVATNGFFVAAEFSLVGARRTRIAQLAAEGNVAARLAQKAFEHLDNYIAATQLGITLSSLALGWIGEPAIGHIFEALFEAILPHEWVETASTTVSLVIAFSLVTLLHIVMGELVPKSIALQQPESTTLVVVRPVSWFLWIFRPIISLMNGIGNAIVRLMGFQPAGEHSSVHSAEELEMLVHSSREAGLLEESEEQLLRRVFDFADITVEEIMQPRVNVDALPLHAPLGDMLDVLSSTHHSRYVVYEDSIDNVVGLLLTKDLLECVIQQPELLTQRDQPFDLKPLLREPLFVPQTLDVDKVLERMQKTKIHLAVVIDEYGGMAGLATMEDVIELLVGDVQDEFDEEETDSIRDVGRDAVVDGLVSMTDIVERFGRLTEEPDSTTIGGYIAEKLNRIPELHDQIALGDYDVRVEDMDGMRVARVRFSRRNTLPATPPDKNADANRTEET